MTLTFVPRDPRIHVFSVSDGDLSLAHQTYLSRLSGPDAGDVPLANAFGAAIDATYCEVFSVDDISPMTLREYLAQAHDIKAEVLAPDAARLDALSGDVVVLAPLAVEGVTTLSPRPELTHIGSYAPAEVDNTPRDLPPGIKQTQLTELPEATSPPVPRKIIAWIAVAALLAAAILVFVI